MNLDVCVCGHKYESHKQPIDALMSNAGSRCELCSCAVYQRQPIAKEIPNWKNETEIKVIYKVSDEGDWYVEITQSGVDYKNTQHATGNCAKSPMKILGRRVGLSNYDRAVNAALSIINNYFCGRKE